MRKIVIATGNRDKLTEIRELLKGLPLEVATIADYPGLQMPEEDRPTFKGNAAKKAEAVAAFCGEVALADDSGLEVRALGGRPGVHSARYAGSDGDYAANNRLLLEELRGVPAVEREARFVAVIAVAVPGDKTYFAHGACPGRIAEAPRGSGGFGYDPLFIYEPSDLTFAEMPAEKKNLISHRARALRQTRELLGRLLARSAR